MAEEQALRDSGAQLLREGKVREAVEKLKEATAQNPQDEGAWRLLGAALGQSHDPEGSVGAFQKAVTLVPTSAKNHYNLAVALQVAERTNEARQHLEKALALDPSYEQARLRLRDLAAKTAPAPMGTLAPAAPPPPPTSLTPVGGGGLQPMGGGGLQPMGGGGGLQPIGGGAPEPPATGLRPVGGSAPEYSSQGGYTPPASLSNPQSGPPTGSRDKPLDIHEGIRATGFDAYRNLQGDVDSAVRGFNFGALVFGPIWLWNHGMADIAKYWIVGRIALRFGFAAFNFGWGDMALEVIQLAARVFLGFFGNRLGWENRSWDDVDEFKKCQRIWAWWGLGVIALAGVLFFTLSAFVLSMLGLSALAGAKDDEPTRRTFRGPDGSKMEIRQERNGTSEIKMPDGSTMRTETNADGSSTMRLSDGTVMHMDAQGKMTVTEPGQNRQMQPGGRQ